MIDFVDLFNACLYIQDNLDADLSLLFLAQTVGLSRFRFHRVFKAWRGETLHDFVTRMRMERAAFELSYPIPCSSRRSIKAIALASGYKSLSSFSHAFSSYSQLSPREFRNRALHGKTIGRRRSEAGLPRSDPAAGTFGQFSIDVSEQPERRIAVLDAVRPSQAGTPLAALSRVSATAPVDGERYGVELLPNLMARARGEGNLSMKVARLGCVGVGIDARVGSAHRGNELPDPPRSCIQLSAGRYAVIEGDGTLASLYRAWRRGFDDWLAASGECPKADRLYVRFSPLGAAVISRIALFIPLEEVAAVKPLQHRPSRQDARMPGTAS